VISLLIIISLKSKSENRQPKIRKKGFMS